MKIIFLGIIIFGLSILSLHLSKTSLDARPGGGGSYSSGGGGGFSSRGSSGGSSGGGGGDLWSVGLFVFTICGFIAYRAAFVSQDINGTPTLIARVGYIFASIVLNLLAALCVRMSSIAMAMVGFMYLVGPFVVVYFAFRHLFTLRETIYVAKIEDKK